MKPSVGKGVVISDCTRMNKWSAGKLAEVAAGAAGELGRAIEVVIWWIC